jgi:hypothetical protein
MCFIFDRDCPCCSDLISWGEEAFRDAVEKGTIGNTFAHCSWCLEKFHQISYSLQQGRQEVKDNMPSLCTQRMQNSKEQTFFVVSEHRVADDENYLLMKNSSRPGER